MKKTVACSWSRPGGCTRTSASSRPRRSTTAGSPRAPGWSASASSLRAPSTGPACVSCQYRTGATGASPTRRRTSLPSLCAALWEETRGGPTAPGTTAQSRWTMCSSSRRTTPKCSGYRRGCPAPGWARSISSRARRRRWLSTRWRPQRPRMRPTGWSSCTV